MNTPKRWTLGILLLLPGAFAWGQTNIYVSNTGNDNNPGSFSSPVRTLEGAQIRVTSPGTVTYNIILMNDIRIDADDDGNYAYNSTDRITHPISGRADYKGTLTFYKSGSANHPINIYSLNGFSQINRTIDYWTYMLKLLDVAHVHIHHVEFYNSTRGAVMFDNADYSSVTFCHFEGNNPPTSSGGVIWMGISSGNVSSVSERNEVSNNLFSRIGMNAQTNQFHAIYLSIKAHNNEVYNNTIHHSPAYGIHGWHGNYKNNVIAYNMVQQKWNSSSVWGILIGYDQSAYSASSVSGNSAYSNYVYDPYQSAGVKIETDLQPYNSAWDNVHFNNKRPNDPYWLSYDPDQVSHRMVTGDFDRDGRMDDIAAFYDYGNNETRIHVWQSNGAYQAFDYASSSGWWSVTGYNANMITGRVVAGDFDRDGYQDDIAAFYDYGNGQTRIHVWTSTGSSFQYSGSSGWWSQSGYSADKITGRVVSGDFDRDGYHDDIAVFYDNGGSNTRIDVFRSTGAALQRSGSSGWWSYAWYTPGAVTDRVVSGDFDRDGYHDDIATFYDYSSSYTRIHVFRSTSSSFQYSGSSGWWYGGAYNANQISARVVSGDFDRDGRHDDIAAYYDYGSGSTHIHVWKSSGSSFAYEGDNGWWQTTGYAASEITGRVLSGDFDKDGRRDDLVAFYDHSGNRGNVRTNVWESDATSFTYVNGSLGFPWFTTYDAIASISLKTDVRTEIPEQKSQNTTRLYPNPVTDHVTIELTNPMQQTRVRVYNLAGALQLTTLLNNPSGRIDLQSLSPGMYLLEVSYGEITETHKLIKR